ncbi:hypothetical protein C4K68_25085 [Pokkaliibacter plantistimulans]|uniref:LPS-assembly protein LptD n=1 Tax=Proteobacteria bacterium 228 TaxID=2083153 RepID=A0A2S5KJQ1_9PROT|nr:LPS-assembly protein LptD [Pokkaliibacter plantistimulans]PPC74596.1 hypothetical protein C4K68_25085 [Pokkaliibacter plantistimulans]
MTARHHFVKTPLVLAIGAVIVLMRQGQAYAATPAAADSTEAGWNCSQTTNGRWDCNPSAQVDSPPALEPAVPAKVTEADEEAVQAQLAPLDSRNSQPSQHTETDAAQAPAREAAVPMDTSESAAPAETAKAPDSPSRAAAGTSSPAATYVASQAKPSETVADSLSSLQDAGLAGSQSAAVAQGWPIENKPAAGSAIPTPYSYLDWYQNPKGVDPTNHCEGFYQEPSFTADDLKQPQEHQQVYVLANRSSTRLGDESELYGPVYVRQGAQRVAADYAKYDQANGEVHLQGNLRYRQPGMLVVGQSGDVNLSTSASTMHDVQFVQYDRHLRGVAASLSNNEKEQRTELSSAYFTRCEPGNDSWTLHGSSIVLHKDEGYGEAYNATLRVADVPILYLPWFSFPISDKRKSGFLYPDFSVSSKDGIEIATPYYLNLAPNYDATITPRLIEKRGLLTEAEFRYLNDWSSNVFSAAYMPHDQIADKTRWLLGVDHTGNPAPRWYTRAYATKVGDIDYEKDLSVDLSVEKDTHLDQVGEVRYYGDNWNAGARVKHYQTLDDTIANPYQESPHFDVSGSVSNPVQNLGLGYSFQTTNFTRKQDNLSGIDKATGLRTVAQANASYNLVRPWGFVRGSTRLNQRLYSLDNMPSGYADSDQFTIPTATLDTGLVMERQYDFRDESFSQTLEPRLFYTYTPYQDQSRLPLFDTDELTFNYDQLWRDYRFTGQDRIGDMNQVSAGLTSRFYEDDGSQRAMLGVGQTFYFQDRKVRLEEDDETLTSSTSPIAGRGEFQINQRLSLLTDAVWSPQQSVLSDSGVTLRYQSDIDHIINLRLRKFYEDDPESSSFDRDDFQYQTDMSVIWPISAQYSLLARWNRDIEESRTLETMLGVEYENCCWRVRALQRNWYDGDAEDDERRKSGVFLQFTLKGLAGFNTGFGDSGSNTSSILEEITGFEERESNNK